MFLLRLGRYLAQHGNQVDILTLDEPGEWFSKAAEMGLRATNMQPPNGLRWWQLPAHSLRAGQQLAAGGYDAVLLNHVPAAQASIGLLQDDVVVAPIIHNDHPDMYRVACSNASRWNVAVAVGPKVATVARAMARGRPLEVITHGVDVPDAGKRPNSDRPTNCVRMAFVGRLEHAQKGILYLPDIIVECNRLGVNVTLSVAGDGADRPRLEHRLHEYGISDQVTFMGVLSTDQVYALLLNSHVLLMPSHYEGLGIVLLEAQACGCVPIATYIPGVTDAAVQHELTGFLCPMGDVGAFANAVAQLAGDPPTWQRMSRSAHSLAEQEHSIEVMGQRYEQLIRTAMNEQFALPRPRASRFASDFALYWLQEGLRRARARAHRAWHLPFCRRLAHL